MTGIVVTYNTPAVFAEAYEALRQYHPALPLVIVDGSPDGSPCHAIVNSLRGGHNTVIQLCTNVGHGLGLNLGIMTAKDEQLLLMDSDAIMQLDPLEAMAQQLTGKVYGVGEVYKIGMDGLHRNPVLDLPYLRPYFMLLSRSAYYRFPQYIHHGSPLVKAMVEIYKQGLSEQLLYDFPVKDYILHTRGATRAVNRSNGLHEIPNKWDV